MAVRGAVELQRLMADPDLPCQVASAMSTELPFIPKDTCIRDIASGIADFVL